MLNLNTNLPFRVFSIYAKSILFKRQLPGVVESVKLFRRILYSSANSEDTLNVFYRSWRIRQKYLIVFRECARKFLAFKENTASSELVSMYLVVSVIYIDQTGKKAISRYFPFKEKVQKRKKEACSVLKARALKAVCMWPIFSFCVHKQLGCTVYIVQQPDHIYSRLVLAYIIAKSYLSRGAQFITL
jgi:hypothetical protein